MASPSSRTIDWFRQRGYVCGTVERYNSFTKRRHDLFGCIDIIAISDDETIGLQATSGTNHSGHVTKILENCPQVNTWLGCKNRKLYVVSFRKGGPRGKRKTWIIRISEIVLGFRRGMLRLEAVDIDPETITT